GVLGMVVGTLIAAIEGTGGTVVLVGLGRPDSFSSASQPASRGISALPAASINTRRLVVRCWGLTPSDNNLE
ncbi:MAG: hypothetical protein QGG73_10855, partial [Candidatus Hydrogenedentes bacterium]|nr:hypothetical protein [Candidatus Hydrogenedentota bacterium]